jgi:ABC-type branched-subunit amino acid transport system permease subunit
MAAGAWGYSGLELCEQSSLVGDGPPAGFLSVFAASNHFAFSFGVPTLRLRAVGF